MTPAAMQTAPLAGAIPGALAMPNLNEVRLSGRLVRDPAIHCATVGRVVMHLDLAVNRRYRDQAGKWHKQVAFVPVTVWNSMAAYSRNRLRKGAPLYVEGRLLSETWKSLDGKRHSALKVHASRVQALRVETAAIPGPAATIVH